MFIRKVFHICLILLIFFMVGCQGSESEDSYRIIQIVETKGNVQIKREGVGTLQAYPQMRLLNNDRVTVDSNSYARLSLDDDKYVYVESNTIFVLNVDADNSSNISINVEKGSIIDEIERTNDGAKK